MKILICALLALTTLPLWAQLSGTAKSGDWGGYWWSMERAETALGWTGESGRRKWSTRDIKTFSKCLQNWQRNCSRFTVNQSVALSPLMKFDLYVRNQLKKNYGNNIPRELLSFSAENELEIHYIADSTHPHYEAIGYAGKCTGWALSTFFHTEPIKAKTINGIKFTPADIKALLATKYNAAQFFVPNKWAIGNPVRANMSGARYQRARADVLPHQLIQALQQNIGQKKMPVLADLDPEEGVWNHPIFAYKINITKRQRTEIEGILEITYADDQVGIDQVFSTKRSRPDHLIRKLKFAATIPSTNWRNSFAQIKNSRWIGEARNQHPDSLVLGIESDWLDLIHDYEDSELASEINFEFFKMTDMGTGYDSLAISHLLEAYYY